MGSIRKREGKRGVSWQIDYIDPTGKRVRQSFKKRKDAAGELAKRESLIAENRYLDVKKDYKTTLGELVDRYSENFKHQASYKTGKEAYLRNFKDHFGEQTLLANIRYVHIETYRNHLKRKLTRHKTIRTDASINREMSCLHHLFAKGVEWEMMEQSPFDKGKSLILKENNQRLRFLEKDEIDVLLEECPDYLRDIVLCAVNTGMRRGEILTLKWDQIRNGQIYLQKTKTNRARQIPVNDALAAVFKRIRRERPFVSDHVFLYDGQIIEAKSGKRRRPKKSGEAKPINNVKKAWYSALKRARIEDFQFRDLRHTFASQLVMHGASLKDVQELLGHTTMNMTLRYAHLSAEHKKKAVNLLNGLTAPESSMSQNVTNSNSRKLASL